MHWAKRPGSPQAVSSFAIPASCGTHKNACGYYSTLERAVHGVFAHGRTRTAPLPGQHGVIRVRYPRPNGFVQRLCAAGRLVQARRAEVQKQRLTGTRRGAII